MAALAMCLAGCAAEDRELTFSGRLIPTAGTCDPESRAVLTLRHGAVAFAPNTGTLVLRGTANPAGHVGAQLTAAGIDRKPYRLILDATRQARTIAGTYTTPRCRYAVSLELAGE